MKITVLSGSPKGENSNTLVYLRYIQKHYPKHRWSIHYIGRDAPKIESDEGRFKKIVADVKQADALLWVYPITYFLVPWGMKRFIELVLARGARDAFEGKYASAITTSMHLFDQTSHAYIHGISEDLGMRYVPGYSAQFNEIMEEEPRRQLLLFAADFLRTVEKKDEVEAVYPPVSPRVPAFRPKKTAPAAKTGSHKVLLLTDETEADLNLVRMTDVFLSRLPNRVEIVNINKIRLAPCRNCLVCCYDGVCAINDDMNFIYQNRILPADAIVWAGTIKDRYLSARWKMFFDRFFLNGHRPVLFGKQGGFIVSGPLRQIPNLRTLLTGFAETFGVNNCGFVTDEYKESRQVTGLLSALSDRMIHGLENGIRRPPSFLGVGGHKILRDINFFTRFIFTENYRYYREHGLFDFPHDQRMMRLMGRIIPPLMRIGGFRKKFQAQMNENMIKPLREALKDS
jgi:multimeric flavodoxin WrbA